MIIKYDVPEHLINKFITKTEEQQQEIITNALSSNLDILLKMSLDMRIEQLDTHTALIKKMTELEDKLNSGVIVSGNTNEITQIQNAPSYEPKMNLESNYVYTENVNNDNKDDDDGDFFG